MHRNFSTSCENFDVVSVHENRISNLIEVSWLQSLGAIICVAHTCHCGERVERDGLHGLSCTKSAGRFSRHATLIFLMKQTLGSLDLPSRLKPRGLYRSDGKCPDCVTMIPWEMGKQLVWDVTVVDSLVPSRLN